MCTRETHCPPATGLEEGYCTIGMVSDWWNFDTKENAIKRYHKILPKRWGDTFFWSSCSPNYKLSDEQSLYEYIYPEGWNTQLPRMSGTFPNDIELNTLSLKRQKRTTCNLAWSSQCIRFSSAPLIQMVLDFFNNPMKVGEIITKYFNSAFMKFTVKVYTTHRQSLEIVIMMDILISPLLFVLIMELILRGAANTLKGMMNNEHLTLPPSIAFMDDITILVPSKIATNGLQQRYFDLFTWARMKAKAKNKSKPIVCWRICPGDPFQNWVRYGPKSQGEDGKEFRKSLFSLTVWSS